MMKKTPDESATAPPDEAPEARVYEATLDNGLRMLILPIDKAPVVTLQVWYRVGSRNEQLGRTGLSHILEHMMFKGTDKLEPEEFDQIIQENGGNSNAFTSKDFTTYFETLRSDRLDIALELEADRMQNLKLDEEHFEPERNVVMEERRLRNVDNPWGALFEVTTAAAFVAHSYMWPIIGWMSDLESLRLEDLQRHYETYYTPNNALVVIAGNVDPEATAERVKAHFGSIPRGPDTPDVTLEEPPQSGERRVSVHKEANLPALVWAYRVPNGLHEDAYALEVLTTLLSEGESSRLHRRLVLEDRLLLGVSTDYPFLSLDPDLFTFTGQVLPGRKVEEVESVLAEEIEKVQDEPVSEKELQKAKNQLEAEFVFAQDSNFYQAMLLGRFELLRDWRDLDRYLPNLRAVTAEDVQRVARKYLVPEHRTVGVLVPTGPPDASAPPPPPSDSIVH